MLLWLILGSSLGLSCAVDQQTVTSQGSDDDESYYPNVNFSDTFDWKLLKEFASKYNNVLLSPISLKLTLALLYQGASGSTEKEFQNVLQFVDKKSVNDYYSQILSVLQASERSEYLLNMGTSIFLDSEIRANSNFESKANQFYRTEIKPVNFTNSLSASNTINSWVNKITNGKVSEIIKAGELQETIMLIANAIYFKGTWRHQFPKNQTYFSNFVVNMDQDDNVKTVNVPFMSTTDIFFIKESEELDSKILRLPYKGSGYSMFIILPNTLGGLPNLIKKINLHNLSSLLYSLEKRLVDVRIPKFKANFKAKLADTLDKFGLHQMFQNTASFTGIAKGDSNLLRKLVVSDIIQKTGIELDEEGSVVYSATGVNIGNKFGEPKEVFYATHPFLFFIEGPNGNILFNGKIENPLETESVFKGTAEPSTQPPILNSVVNQVFPTSTKQPARTEAPTTKSTPSFSSNSQPILEKVPNLEPTAVDLEPSDSEELLYRFNLFDMELLNVFSEINTNVFISPASIKTTLAMILEGAKGSCALEISEALRIPNINQKGVRNILVQVLENLQENSPNTSLENSNAIFISDKHKINDKYHKVIVQFYNGTIKNINFKNVGTAVNAVNNWVTDATHGNIKEIIGSQSISPETSAIVINALYFKGKWKAAFDPQITKDKCFRTVNGCVPTPMMRASSNFDYNYVSGLRAHAIDIPYENNFSMLILLPSEEANIGSVIRDLAYFKIGEILKKLKSSDIVVEIPKFAFDYSTNLVDYLRPLKIREIFGSQANLSGIIDNGNVIINTMVQKTRVEVNEEGTIAAAATGAILIPLIGSTSVVVDRPFIFYIYHKKTNTILFEGILRNPTE